MGTNFKTNNALILFNNLEDLDKPIPCQIIIAKVQVNYVHIEVNQPHYCAYPIVTKVIIIQYVFTKMLIFNNYFRDFFCGTLTELLIFHHKNGFFTILLDIEGVAL